jgi:hypothetical protein
MERFHGCEAASLIYTSLMKNSRNYARALLGLMIVTLVTGCGGLMGTHTISPATFFLPGIVQTPPPGPESIVLPQQAALPPTAPAN